MLRFLVGIFTSKGLFWGLAFLFVGTIAIYGSTSEKRSLPDVNYLFPTENQTVFYKEITLSWTCHKKMDGGLLQISENKDFTSLVLETQVKGNSFTAFHLTHTKEYYWRVINPADSKNYNDFSFFKTTSLNIDYRTPCCLNLIPTHIGDQPLLYVDNPDSRHYTISIHDLDNFDKVLEKNSSSEYQCIPAYKLSKGKYLIKIKVPDEEYNNISEIVMIKDE